MIQVHILYKQSVSHLCLQTLHSVSITHINSYITKCRWPVDLIVGADTGALCLKSKRERGDVED